MNDSELSNTADRLFKAFEEHDLDTVRELCAPEARFWSSVTMQESSVEQLLAHLPSVRERIGVHRYEDVRRVVAPDGFVEQHAVRSTRPDGTELDLEVCVVVRIDEDGRIDRFDEYVAAPIDL